MTIRSARRSAGTVNGTTAATFPNFRSADRGLHESMAGFGPSVNERWTLHPLRQFPDARGAVLHMLRATDPHFERFGEIYFSTINRGWSKAGTSIYARPELAVPIGSIRIVLFEEGGSPRGTTLGRDDYQLLTIPPGSGTPSRVWPKANRLSRTARPSRSTRPRAPICRSTRSEIPYAWKRREHCHHRACELSSAIISQPDCGRPGSRSSRCSGPTTRPAGIGSSAWSDLTGSGSPSDARRHRRRPRSKLHRDIAARRVHAT